MLALNIKNVNGDLLILRRVKGSKVKERLNFTKCMHMYHSTVFRSVYRSRFFFLSPRVEGLYDFAQSVHSDSKERGCLQYP